MGIEVASTILAQLGGERFRTMTGARDFSATENSLTFRLPRAGKKITSVEIALAPTDTYTMTFRNVRRTATGHVNKVVEEHSGIYSDMLESVFTEVTGLYTRLPGFQPALGQRRTS